jgi:hypothetical protein
LAVVLVFTFAVSYAGLGKKGACFKRTYLDIFINIVDRQIDL